MKYGNVMIVAREPCDGCGGTGRRARDPFGACGACGGRGYRDVELLHPGEPFFLIRGQDRHAPAAVGAYAGLLLGASDEQGANEVLALLGRIAEFQAANPQLVKDPD